MKLQGLRKLQKEDVGKEITIVHTLPGYYGNCPILKGIASVNTHDEFMLEGTDFQFYDFSLEVDNLKGLNVDGFAVIEPDWVEFYKNLTEICELGSVKRSKSSTWDNDVTNNLEGVTSWETCTSTAFFKDNFGNGGREVQVEDAFVKWVKHDFDFSCLSEPEREDLEDNALCKIRGEYKYQNICKKMGVWVDIEI